MQTGGWAGMQAAYTYVSLVAEWVHFTLFWGGLKFEDI